MARITKAQILEATKVAVRIDPSQFFGNSYYGRCCKKSMWPSIRCTRDRYHPGPHVCIHKWDDWQVKRIWFSADQKMRDMYEHYRDSQPSTASQSIDQHLDSKEI